jgi:hypothetical protein
MEKTFIKERKFKKKIFEKKYKTEIKIFIGNYEKAPWCSG